MSKLNKKNKIIIKKLIKNCIGDFQLLNKIKFILFFEILIICFKIIKIFGRSNQNFKIYELFYNVYL